MTYKVMIVDDDAVTRFLHKACTVATGLEPGLRTVIDSGMSIVPDKPSAYGQ